MTGHAAATATSGSSRNLQFERERGVYELRVQRGLAHVVAKVGSEPERTDRLRQVFQTLADERIPIFLIKLHRTAVSFALSAEEVPHVQACLRDVARDCKTRQDLALVTILASNMRDLTGIMVSIADSLQEAGARLYGVGDSHNSVQCLIEGSSVNAAIQRLEERFGLDRREALA